MTKIETVGTYPKSNLSKSCQRYAQIKDMPK